MALDGVAAKLAYMNGPSAIPGLTGGDVMTGSMGQGKNGHGIYDPDDDRLKDPNLHARVAHWLRQGAYTLKTIKDEGKKAGVPVTGNKRVVALRLAFQNLPALIEIAPNGSSAVAATASSLQKPTSQKKTAAKVTAKKKAPSAAKYPPRFRGCKKCGGADHQRCTKHKCPRHPEYELPARRLHRSDSYDWPDAFYLVGEEEEGRGGGDWSGRPGHRCQLCGRSSEGVGPRRGFDYEQDVCGGCTDL